MDTYRQQIHDYFSLNSDAIGRIKCQRKMASNTIPSSKNDDMEQGWIHTNLVSWGLYLLGYEFLFRGVLFLGLIPFTGLNTAIGINTALYALAHLYKGKKETIGSIPLGIVLCYITWKTGTIWTAFAIHWIMASNNFIWSHYYNSKPPNTFKQSN